MIQDDPISSKYNQQRQPVEQISDWNQILQHCTQCQVCVRDCAFLQDHGDPKTIAEGYNPAQQKSHNLAFQCHLCGLCTAVCPESLSPAQMFLDMRRHAATLDAADFSEHRALINYEKLGMSKRFTWYSLPDGCESVFFPGCALSGSRAETTYRTYQHLKKQMPSLGIVLDCCGKPSHDLGNDTRFSGMFTELTDYLVENGIKNVLTACPNCQKTFSEYGKNVKSRMVYEVLDASLSETSADKRKPVVVHDPCVTRFETETQHAVRSLLKKRGHCVLETKHSGPHTLCCGEGAGVKSLFPDYAEKWADKRLASMEEGSLVSYCAACTAAFSDRASSFHLLDLLFNEEKSSDRPPKETKAPVTYFNRLRLKQRLRREAPVAATTRERTFHLNDEKNHSNYLQKISILALITASIIGFRALGGINLLQQDELQRLITGYGIMAPLAYMLLYSIAPALFLPGLPIGIVGGILFGPLWGVIYTIISATAGASLAFLISRYLARDIVESKMNGPRWQNLNEQVERDGWKIVALTRLIPLFPFNMLNYAFGLTGIKFSHYCLATFIFMLPGTIAFIVFSSSLPELFKGHLTLTSGLSIGLIVVISILPVFYKRLKQRHRIN